MLDRALIDKQKHRIMVFKNGSGTDAVEIVADLDKLDEVSTHTISITLITEQPICNCIRSDNNIYHIRNNIWKIFEEGKFFFKLLVQSAYGVPPVFYLHLMDIIQDKNKTFMGYQLYEILYFVLHIHSIVPGYF